MVTTINGKFCSRSECPGCLSKEYIEIGASVKGVMPKKLEEFCSQTYHRELVDLFKSDFRYDFVECRSCGLKWQKYVLSSAFYETLYSKWIVPVRSFRKARSTSTYAVLRAHAKVLVLGLFFCPNFGRNIYLGGAGWGLRYRWLSKIRNVSVSEICRRRLRVLRIFGFAVDEGMKSDLIVLEEVLEHLIHPRLFLAELLADTGKNGTCLLITVPLANEVVDMAKGWAQVFEHLNGFTPESLRSLVKSFDCEVIYQRVTGDRRGLEIFCRFR